MQAADEERRRIERDLHDGAQQRLLRLAMTLEVADSALPEDANAALRASLQAAGEELAAVRQELRELASGIHPGVLTQRGLGAAVRSLAEVAAVPVRVLDVPGRRLSPEVESAGYFVVSEALANVAKHARTTEATVSAHVHDGMLELAVADDGAGGAVLGRGSGLTGLRDRVEALGGSLDVLSPPGGGTRLVARLPAREALASTA